MDTTVPRRSSESEELGGVGTDMRQSPAISRTSYNDPLSVWMRHLIIVPPLICVHDLALRHQ
jgi:hypothetical protein